ncbi:MAG: OmpA family protein [Paludibacter sp.]|nr:OmpA family protein [Paludibacter sp.]
MKKQFILVLALVLFGVTQAQQTGSFIDFNVGGGYHNLSYKLQNGTEKGQFGYTLNAGYSFFFTPKWGLHTGLGFQSFNSLSNLNYLSATPAVDTQGDNYVFKANYKNWQEKQQALMLDVPLAVMFKQPVTDKWGLLASVGGKIAFPVKASFKSNGGELVTTGYYSKWNVELSDMPQHGFSTMTNTFDGKTTMKTAFMGIADLGGLYKLSEKTDLYVGAYLNYGLNNILSPKDKLIYEPTGNVGIYNGIFASTQTNSVTPFAIGVKVGVYLHLGETKPVVEYELPIAPKKPVPTVEPVAVTEPVPPVAPVQSVEVIQPVETPQPVTPAPPVKEVVVAEQTPKAVEVPVETKVEAPVKTAAQIEPVQKGDPFEEAKRIAESMNVMFGFNSAQVTDSKNEMIKELSTILNANPSIHLILTGHTCNIGTHKVNKALGYRRAHNVRLKFRSHGVPAKQMKTDSKAYDQPLVPNNSKENRARNRRVQILVIKRD